MEEKLKKWLLLVAFLLISPNHDIASGVMMVCAQFLTLTATIFGIDYKWNKTPLVK